uniref:Uncharacterized protein n=1 Tax=Oryza punctata TaxID=4537 RepID=A0A0E0LBX4_ORYPU
MTSQRLRQRHCFRPCYQRSGNTFTSKEEVFTWAKSNKRRLLHAGDINKTSNGYENMGYIKRNGGAFMRVNLLLLTVQRWEARSK